MLAKYSGPVSYLDTAYPSRVSGITRICARVRVAHILRFLFCCVFSVFMFDFGSVSCVLDVFLVTLDLLSIVAFPFGFLQRLF